MTTKIETSSATSFDHVAPAARAVGRGKYAAAADEASAKWLQSWRKFASVNSGEFRNYRVGSRRPCARNQTRPMKNDPTFKLVAAIIFAGVIVAFFSPNPTSAEDHTTALDTMVQAAAVATE